MWSCQKRAPQKRRLRHEALCLHRLQRLSTRRPRHCRRRNALSLRECELQPRGERRWSQALGFQLVMLSLDLRRLLHLQRLQLQRHQLHLQRLHLRWLLLPVRPCLHLRPLRHRLLQLHLHLQPHPRPLRHPRSLFHLRRSVGTVAPAKWRRHYKRTVRQTSWGLFRQVLRCS